jgi:peroxiredoxin
MTHPDYTPRSRWFSASLVLSALILGACQRNSPQAEQPAVPKPPGVPAGTYRVVLQTPGGELPFGLTLDQDNGRWVAYLINGPEHLRVDEVTVSGTHLEILMPGYENRLIADAAGDTLKGEIVLSKANAKQQHVPLQAKRGQSYRFYAPAAAAPGAPASADVSGHWAATFLDDDGTQEADVGEFTQTEDIVTGTILTPTGDHRYLEGQVHGDELDLSTFDGAHVFLYKAKINADGTMSGDFWSGLASHEKWNAKRDPNAKLADAYTYTKMKKGTKRFDFSFPDLNGATVTSKDPQFKGKVMVVALAGSWCPNCHDEAAFLSQLYRDDHGRGLEIVSLMFEHFGDFPRAAAAAMRFQDHYGIGYTMLIAGVSDKDEAGKKLPMLDKFYAFPTTVFIDKKGMVRKIHTGFTGPATGEHYSQFVKEVNDTINELLAEKG